MADESKIYYAYSEQESYKVDAFSNKSDVVDLGGKYQEIISETENIKAKGAFEVGDRIVYGGSKIEQYYNREVKYNIEWFCRSGEERICIALNSGAYTPSGYEPVGTLGTGGLSLPTAVMTETDLTSGNVSTSSQNINGYRPAIYTSTALNARDIGFATNIPIFPSYNAAAQYVSGQIGLESALNYNKAFDPSTGSWIDAPDISYGKIAFYQDLDQSFDLTLISDIDISIVRYSTDGHNWIGTPSLMWDYFMSNVPHTIDGITYASSLFQTNIPIFEDMQTAQGFLNGSITIDAAINYDDITADSEKDVDIGEEVEDMGLNSTSLAGAFCARYAVSKGNLAEISNNFFNDDGSVVDRIVEGLKMFSNKPMEAVIDLNYYPFDVTAYASDSPQQYIYFGSYKMDTELGVNKIVNLNTQIDCGTLAYPKTYGDYRDYEPFTECYIYLPYCGFQKLDIAKYIGKNINVKYGIDLTTGMCEVYILANGRITDRYNGQIGVRQFTSSMDSTEYASNLANGLLSGVGGAAAVGVGAGMILGGVSATLPVLGAVSGFGAVAGGVGLYAMGMQKLGQSATGTQYQSGGGASSMLNQFDVQYPYFMFVYSETYLCDDINIVGKPTNASGNIGNFRGFLKCAEVNLRTSATYEENGIIEDLLRSGVYI